jgi:ferredoxin
MLRIVVDRDLCEGNARCAQVAPKVFRVNDDDKLEILVEEPSEAMREDVEAAVAICPRQALKLLDR